MSQTAYTVDAPVAFAGLIAEAGGREASISRAFENAGAAAGYGAGRPAVAGTDPETQFDVPSGAGDRFLGITVHQHGRQDLELAGDFAFITDEPVELVRRGRIWVIVEEAVTAGDPVFWRHTVNGGLIPGGWRTDLDTANAIQVLQAEFMTDALIDTVAIIDLNLP